MAYTPEEEKKIQQVRVLIGDTPSSPFYPIFQDEEIAEMLELNNWNVYRAAKTAAVAASFQFAQMTYRERTGDIEVWNNVSIQYMKALDNLIGDISYSLPKGLKPYFGGVSWSVIDCYNNDPDYVRSPLTWEDHDCSILGERRSRPVVIEVGVITP